MDLQRRGLICDKCTQSSFCPDVPSTLKLQLQHSTCPRGYWTRKQTHWWLCGDLALGGITRFLTNLVPYIDASHHVWYASPYLLDQNAVNRLNARPNSKSGRFKPDEVIDESVMCEDDWNVVHLISRHPSHTPFTIREKEMISKANIILVHIHGQGAWSQECVRYAISTAVQSAKKRAKIRVIANSVKSMDCAVEALEYEVYPEADFRVIPLPISIRRSAHPRVEDRKWLSDMIGPSPGQIRCLIKFDQPWWVYCGRNSKEKNLEDAVKLRNMVARNGYVDPQLVVVSNSPVQGAFFLPWVSDLSRVYNACDFTISTSPQEGGPIFPVEGILSGCRSISYDVGHMHLIPHILPVPQNPILNSSVDLIRSDEVIRDAWKVATIFDPNRIGEMWMAAADEILA